MKFTYLIVLMMAVTVVFGRTVVKRTVEETGAPPAALSYSVSAPFLVSRKLI